MVPTAWLNILITCGLAVVFVKGSVPPTSWLFWEASLCTCSSAQPKRCWQKHTSKSYRLGSWNPPKCSPLVSLQCYKHGLALIPCNPHLLSFQWWQVEKVNPIKLYEENKVIAGFSLLNLLFKQGRAGLIRGVVDKLIGLYNQKKVKPVVDSLWALEEVRMMFPQQIISVFLVSFGQPDPLFY